MNRFASLLLVLSFVACDKGGGNAPTVTQTPEKSSEPEVNVPKAPATIPQKYVDTFKKNWSKIEELGATFRELADLWAEVAYAAQDESQEIQDAWDTYLRSYNRKVENWVKKSKGLKEFSRVK